LVNPLINTSRTPYLTPLRAADWQLLMLVILIAVALRLFFYTGFFGSDEVTYIDTASNIVNGDWSVSDYVGAIRYGMNLPVAFFLYFFELTEASANAWPLICSVGEVVLVYIIARWLWGTRAALISAGILTLLPIHIHFAGRIMADPPLAFFITLSVALLLRVSFSKSSLVSVAAGLSWGCVFWVKESVSFLYAPIFLLLLFYLTGFSGLRVWLWTIFGMILALVANGLFMYFIAANPMHVFLVMKTAVGNLWDADYLIRSPWFYFQYLFLDIRHTFLLGLLVLLSTIFYFRNIDDGTNEALGFRFIFVWMILLLGVFTFAVVSFSPVKLVMKQTNYMLIFVAPMALLAGWWLASLNRRIVVPLVVLLVCGSLVLAALEQQAVKVFTANSRAAYVFLKEQPNVFLLGSANNLRAVSFYAFIESRPDVAERMTSLGNIGALSSDAPPSLVATRAHGKDVMALIDPQNISWGLRGSAIKSVADVPACWPARGTLAPGPLGTGHWVVQGLLSVGKVLPINMQQKYTAALQPVSTVAPGLLFTVDMACSSNS